MCLACLTGRPVYRLPLASGGRVFMEWHNWIGPSFYRDRACMREIEDWYEQPEICAALEWFQGRGKKA
jgi:hypothetical protein